MNPELGSIRNFFAMGERIGTAGQPTCEQFPLIAEAGYAAVINLGMSDHRDAVHDEEILVSALGMDYIHLPVPFDAPTPEHVRCFCNIMDELAGKKVFIHCIMNYRVSAFMFHYLHKVVGLDVSASCSPMFATWKPDEVWTSLLNWSAKDIGL